VPVAPEVAVVVPTCDRPESLARAVASVLTQTAPAVEVVVVDDGSDPPSVVTDERVRVLRQDANRGVAHARNAGIAATTSPLLAFLDDDDVWRPHELERLTGALLAAGPAAVAAGGGFTIAWPDGHVDDYFPRLAADATLDLLARPVFAPSAFVARREPLVAAGGFPPHIARCEDWALWLRLAELGEFVSVDELLADRVVIPNPERDLRALAAFERAVIEPALAARPPRDRREVRRRRAVARAGLLRDAGRRPAAVYAMAEAALNLVPRPGRARTTARP
jgi:glycosyltransferase involved in cell wall biosynthesis